MLPVELTSFTLQSCRSGVALHWTTATETNNAGFEVQRRASASAWLRVGYVGGSGSSNISHAYSFVDSEATAGTYAYRLKQIDRDGGYVYSYEVHAAVAATPDECVLAQNFPNPFNPSTTIHFAVATEQKARVTVVNVLGQEVRTMFDGVAQTDKSYDIIFDATGLSSGTYFYKRQTADRCEIRKMAYIK
jgi:hypothetical protein